MLFASGCRKKPTATTTPLIDAVKYGHIERAKTLIESGADVNAKDKIGNTPLIEAAGRFDVDLVELLIARGANVNAMNNIGDTPLIEAAKGIDKELVVLLLTRGADVHAQGCFLNTPLHWAAKSGHKPIAQLLFDNGARINCMNRAGQTPTTLAMSADHERIVDFFIDKGADITIHIAAYIGDLEKVKSFIGNGTNVNAENIDGRTPLHWAAKRGNSGIAKLLLANGADPNIRDRSDGAAPLHLAVEEGNKDLSELLVKYGANVNAKYKKINLTPLQIAASYGLKELAELLITNGADVNAKDKSIWWKSDWTPLRYAVERGHIELVQLLIDNGARLDDTNTHGQTLGDIALYTGRKRIAELLIANGIDATIHLSAYVGDRDKTKSFLDSGINVNLQDVQHSTPLHYAAKAGQSHVVQLLIGDGAEINVKYSKDSDWVNDSPLHYAAGEGHAEIVELLIANGAEVDATYEFGCTPLHWAADGGYKDVVELLLDNGADINRKYGNDDTALSEAILNGHRDVVELLLVRGADITAGCMGGYVSLSDATDKDFKELAEYLAAEYGPYSIIVTESKLVRQLLRYLQIEFDGIWIPEETDLEGLDDILRSYLQNTTVIKAKPHFSRKFILTYFDQYSREYSGITRDGAKYVICQMILPRHFPARPPDNAFSMIHGFANGVVRVVFDLKNKTVVEIDCEYWM
jgi:ankyrin repeat protein